MVMDRQQLSIDRRLAAARGRRELWHAWEICDRDITQKGEQTLLMIRPEKLALLRFSIKKQTIFYALTID